MSELPDLTERRVVLAVSGSIAGYKAAELCRLLVRCGATVQVVMTAAARHFVGEATFAALSGRPVATDMFDPVQEERIGHVRLADEAELLVIAPATANVMAKLAAGIADDLLTTAYLAFSGPVLVAPAMNVQMWAHAATQANAETLRQRGHRFVGPGSGELACGHVGAGRMSEPEEILAAAAACLAPQDLAGRSVLVSAGPTREPLDAVRYVGNRSSGRMGYAIAAEARARGARVVLVSGPSALSAPTGVERVNVSTAAEMAQEISARAAAQDAIVMAAAVADYRPRAPRADKIKKEQAGQRWTLELERTEDILAGLGKRRSRRHVLVGFAAETEQDLDRVAPQKLTAKGCDLLVANNVLLADAGFDVETNRVTIYDREGGREVLELMSKRQVAARLLARVATLLARRAGKASTARAGTKRAPRAGRKIAPRRGR